MLYLASLNRSPDTWPGVALEIRDRVIRMASTMTEVLEMINVNYFCLCTPCR